eukprot:TRINITY_DN19716_c0_g1_i1.p1 TRINITY_DN19716_c0_g1~~TRINITY_DN19716_c0_g1_i1.p1  ORF type:complete len:335 (+),score=93.14 TRINITY_DN19716_c0_g1_i1:52-1056(+)
MQQWQSVLEQDIRRRNHVVDGFCDAWEADVPAAQLDRGSKVSAEKEDIRISAQRGSGVSGGSTDDTGAINAHFHGQQTSVKEYNTCGTCGDLVEAHNGTLLMCGHVDHWHCNVCLENCALECVRAFINKDFFGLKSRDLLPGMVICTVCLHPSILAVKVVQSMVMPNKPFKIMLYKQFSVDVESTNILTYHVDTIQQNERRSWAGKFGKENLLFADFRGAWSLPDGTTKPKGKHSIRCPNGSYHWATPWGVERTKRTDPQGWQYAVHWPGTGTLNKWLNTRWLPAPQPTTLVRTRVWRRLRLRLSDDDILLLQMNRSDTEYWEKALQKILEEEY